MTGWIKRKLITSVSTQIFVGMAGLFFLCTAVVGFSAVSHRKTRVLVQRLHEGYVPLGLAISELRSVQDVFVGFLDRYVYDHEPGFARQWLLEALRYRPRVLSPAIERLKHAEQLDKAWGVESHNFFESIRKDLQRIAQRYDQSESAREALLSEASGDVQALRLREQASRRLLARVSERVQHQIRLITQDAYHEEQKAMIRLGVLGGLTLLTAIVIALWIRRVVAPLNVIRRRVTAVATGQASAKLNLERQDELGLLAEEFERMLEAIGQRDIKLREASQRQLQQQTLQEQIFGVLDAAIVSLDRNGVVQAINPAARKLFSVSNSKQITAQTAVTGTGSLLSQDDLWLGLGASGPPWAELLGRAQQGQPAQDTLHLYRDGKAQVFQVSCVPVGASDSALIVLVAHDITAQVQAKAELIHSEKLAAMGRMAAHIAHEIRNPLSSLGLNLELLEQDLRAVHLGNPAMSSSFDGMRQEIERLTRITEEYLGVVRLPAPRLEREDMVEVVKATLALLRNEMAQHQIEIEVQVEAQLPKVMLDESQFRQALLNVLRNAQEAMPEGGRVVIEVVKFEQGIAVRVRDEGIGMSEEQKARSFELFFTTKEKGTGLGLSLTRQICESHGGRVRVLDSPGKGTIVELWIPAKWFSRDH